MVVENAAVAGHQDKLVPGDLPLPGLAAGLDANPGARCWHYGAWLVSIEMPRPMTYQLAANLITAAGSRLTEVRITSLVEGVFYAVVVVEAPEGTVEVDARPSDALNLAVVSGTPVLVDAAVLGDPEATRHTDWEQYPARVPDLAAEARERRASILARLMQEHERPDQPEP